MGARGAIREADVTTATPQPQETGIGKDDEPPSKVTPRSTPRRAGRKPEVTREDWIEAGLTELGRNGAGALRLETLCRNLGITKGSFYWYFASREAFMDILLETWERRDTLALIDKVEAGGGGARAKLEALFRAANAGEVDFRIEQAIRQWGNSNAAIRAMLHRVDDRRIAYMRGLLEELARDRATAELQATLLYAVIFGEAMIFRREDRAARAMRQRAALEAVLGIARPGSAERATQVAGKP